MNPEKPDMGQNSCTTEGMNRRKFMLLTCAACCLSRGLSQASAKEAKVIDAGPLRDYSVNGVDTRFRDQGFFVIRNGAKLVVLSAVCTHKKCKLTAEPDRSFYCECHGSTFAPDGKVTEGPAKRDLPVLPSFTNEAGHLMVKIQ